MLSHLYILLPERNHNHGIHTYRMIIGILNQGMSMPFLNQFYDVYKCITKQILLAGYEFIDTQQYLSEVELTLFVLL